MFARAFDHMQATKLNHSRALPHTSVCRARFMCEIRVSETGGFFFSFFICILTSSIWMNPNWNIFISILTTLWPNTHRKLNTCMKDDEKDSTTSSKNHRLTLVGTRRRRRRRRWKNIYDLVKRRDEKREKGNKKRASRSRLLYLLTNR